MDNDDDGDDAGVRMARSMTHEPQQFQSLTQSTLLGPTVDAEMGYDGDVDDCASTESRESAEHNRMESLPMHIPSRRHRRRRHQHPYTHTHTTTAISRKRMGETVYGGSTRPLPSGIDDSSHRPPSLLTRHNVHTHTRRHAAAAAAALSPRQAPPSSSSPPPPPPLPPQWSHPPHFLEATPVGPTPSAAQFYMPLHAVTKLLQEFFRDAKGNPLLLSQPRKDDETVPATTTPVVAPLMTRPCTGSGPNVPVPRTATTTVRPTTGSTTTVPIPTTTTSTTTSQSPPVVFPQHPFQEISTTTLTFEQAVGISVRAHVLIEASPPHQVVHANAAFQMLALTPRRCRHTMEDNNPRRHQHHSTSIEHNEDDNEDTAMMDPHPVTDNHNNTTVDDSTPCDAATRLLQHKIAQVFLHRPVTVYPVCAQVGQEVRHYLVEVSGDPGGSHSQEDRKNKNDGVVVGEARTDQKALPANPEPSSTTTSVPTRVVA